MTAYTDVLDDAWAQHIAPRKPDAPTVVSTFAGCGGSSLGWSMAGYRELLAVEWQADACQLLRANLDREVQVHHGDITLVDPAVLGLEQGQLDVLDGSPPCQGFSAAGKRQLDDPRNQLFRQFVRLIDAWQPRVFVMENVPNLAAGRTKPLFREIMSELRAAGTGYRVVAQILEAQRHGVPQVRRRLLAVGVRHDQPFDPVHPRPRPGRVTFRQACADLTDLGATRGRYTPSAQYLARMLVPGQRGMDLLIDAGLKPSYFGTRRLEWDEPAKTLTSDPREHTYHPALDRVLSGTEMSRLMSFPDQYDWLGLEWKKVKARAGNAVPPLLMRDQASALLPLLAPSLAPA